METNKIYEKLEFNNVLTRVAKKAHSSHVKEQILNTQHLTNYDDVIKQLNITDEIMRLFASYFEFNLRGLHDILPILDKLDNQLALTGMELNQISYQEEVSVNLRKYYNDIEDKKDYPFFVNKVDELGSILILAQKISRMINPEGLVYEDATSRLVHINHELEQTNQKITNMLRSYISSNSDHLMENIITYRNNRAVLLVKLSSKNVVKGIIHDESSSKQTVFIEPSNIVELNNYLQTLEYQKTEEIEVVLKELSNNCLEHFQTINNNYNIFCTLDLFKAKALYSIEIEGNIPIINKDSAKLEIFEGRHPLIDADKVVANDFYLCNNETKYRIVLISGSNTGGKTVALKMVGLFSLMVQSGLAIPVKESSNLPIYSNIFVDIGDEQSIENSLSTFSSHLTNITNITNNVCKHSLVLLDELGSGTDPREGENLALAVLEYLYKKDASVIVTTHYSKLKNYAITTDYVRSASVLFDEDFNRPRYKISFDTFASSNAFEIAEYLGLKNEIVKKAREYYHNDLNTSDELLLKLQDEQIKISKEKNELNILKDKYQKLNNDAQLVLEKSLNDKERIINKAKEQANELVVESKVKADEIIKKLKKNDSFVNHKVNELKTELDSLIQDLPNTIDNSQQVFKVNDLVEIIKLKRQGVITKVLSKNSYEVSIGNIKTKVKHEEIRYLSEYKPEKEKKVKARKYTNKSVSLELNLIGLRVEEALIALNRYLDDALLANYSQVRIVHGFGTGALRKAVHEELARNKHVKDFDYGKYNEGGQGATVVNLK